MEEIRLEGVRKTYGREVAVADLDLRVEPGEFLTILGPSGCGKTTTLRIIAGLEDPDRGDVHLGGTVVFSRERGVIVPPERRNLGLIFQSYALWPHMTVARNITLALREKGLSRQEIEERLVSALEKVQMDAFRDRYPSELSGGQQQRVAVARLIALRPSFLLMDEPLSNLDAMLRIDMRSELKQLHRDLGATTVYVTHDQIEALTLSDTVVVMDRGVVLQKATPFDIYHHPSTLFVAEFVGNPRINSFQTRLRRMNGETVADFGDLTVPLAGEPATKLDHVIATLRPEDIRISQVEKPGWLKGRISSIQPTGSETIVQTESAHCRFTVLQSGFFQARLDDDVWLRIESRSLNLFDPETGRSLAV
ncbi:MAG: ABC transporter ATP-binding protein [Rhodospirillales bacterium]|nr:MAG: ABC transporter ATP-binding protein [Rhodospirillales bacterium]